VLVDPAGALAGAAYFERWDVYDEPRLDVFDVAGVRRVILRHNLPVRKGEDGVLLIFLDGAGHPRLRLGNRKAELLDAAGKVIFTRYVAAPGSAPDVEAVLAVTAHGRPCAEASVGEGEWLSLLDGDSTLAHWFRGEGNRGTIEVDGVGLTVDMPFELHEPDDAAVRHIGPLRGVETPSTSRWRFVDDQGVEHPAPTRPWTGKFIDFDQAAPISMR